MKNVILIMLIISTLVCVYFFIIRNNKVYKFRAYISILIYLRGDDMINDGASFRDILELWDTLNNISYEKMLFSFKPLKMKYWFTEKELKLLGYKYNDNRKHKKISQIVQQNCHFYCKGNCYAGAKLLRKCDGKCQWLQKIIKEICA